jgi:hypothetical protein
MCTDMGAASCGTSGSCDGNGGCAKYDSGTICKAPSCMMKRRRPDHRQPLRWRGPVRGRADRWLASPTPCSATTGRLQRHLHPQRGLRAGDRLHAGRAQLRQEGAGPALPERQRVRQQLLRRQGLLPGLVPGPLPLLRAGRHPRRLHPGPGGRPRSARRLQGHGEELLRHRRRPDNGNGACRRYAPGTSARPARATPPPTSAPSPPSATARAPGVSGAPVNCSPYRATARLLRRLRRRQRLPGPQHLPGRRLRPAGATARPARRRPTACRR